MKRVFLFVTILLCAFVMFPIDHIKAVGAPIWVNVNGMDEALDEGETSSDGTAHYENNTLTLTNYNGGTIYFEDGENLTVVLKGTNVITTDGEIAGFDAYSGGDVKITGSGTLLIQDAGDGILMESGSLAIDNTTITIKNVSYNGIKVSDGDFTLNKGKLSISNIGRNGIYLQNGKVNFSGNLVMDDDLALKEEMYGMVMYYNAVNTEGGNIIVNGNLNIKNAGKALITNESIIINSGTSSIETYKTAIDSENGFSMLGGNFDVKVLSSEDNSLKYGVSSMGIVLIKGGLLHISVPENNIVVAALKYAGSTPTFNIDEKLTVIPNKYSLQDIEIDGYYSAIVLGLKDTTISGNAWEGYTVTNVPNEVTFKQKVNEEVNPKTGDNIGKYLLISIVSLLGLLGGLINIKKFS